eukprot:TRINITY_DN13219_c0_g1_i3.p1 TRINITY_DN13219_c0_g1~~TRINITY_DN13219_c0_g1_i3.p1  ORF type:complete len:105 (-),score=6.77 TRINITY_DN13219_c0_g1_i3:40-354(-)
MKSHLLWYLINFTISLHVPCSITPMAATDRLLGLACLLVSITVLVYYTTWVFIMPLLPPHHMLQAYFLPQMYAIYLPSALLVAGVATIASFFMYQVSKQSKKTK